MDLARHSLLKVDFVKVDFIVRAIRNTEIPHQ
jgi:hypothetical protein